LLDPPIAWEPLDARTVRARFTSGRQTISATLLFGDDGLLTNFAIVVRRQDLHTTSLLHARPGLPRLRLGAPGGARRRTMAVAGREL
jgi:hypothetical protein